MADLSLRELAAIYAQNERAASVVELSIIEALLLSAVRFYLGYAANLAYFADLDASEPLTLDCRLNLSEWAIIKPLFLLYVEREQAIELEASRAFGAELFGRSTSEVNADILQVEAELPRRAFSRQIVTV